MPTPVTGTPFVGILGKSTWTTAYQNTLPDSSFMYIEPGGAKDDSGRTTPRSLRHLPIYDADGHLDLPHLRDALARIPKAGPWLSADKRQSLHDKATKLLDHAKETTHKAAEGVPRWALGYVAHRDRHEALGVPDDKAHAAWAGDPKLGERGLELLKAYRRRAEKKVASAGAAGEVEPDVPAVPPEVNARLRAKVADHNTACSARKLSMSAATTAWQRGASAYRASTRPAVKSEAQWGSARANAFLKLSATGKATPGYTADRDLLPKGTTAPDAAKPPKAATASPSASIRATKGKPPRGKAPLAPPVKPSVATTKGSSNGFAPEVVAGPLLDFDFTPEDPADQLDLVSTYPARGAVRKDDAGEADLNASGRLAPEQGFERRTYRQIPIVVDRPAGFVQTGVDKAGQEWTRTYKTDYGYIPATAGGDDEELDVFLGPDADADVAYVAVQQDDDGDFDELKVFLGYPDEDAARAAYLDHIPEKYLDWMFEVPLILFQALLGFEPEEFVAKAASDFIVTVKASGVGVDCLKTLLKGIEKHGATGHSFGIQSDDDPPVKLGGWDGDGGARAEVVDVKEMDASKKGEPAEPTSKADLAFLAIAKDANGEPKEERYVLGPVLIPGDPTTLSNADLQGDIAPAEEIEKTERAWLAHYQNLGLQHAVKPGKIDEFREEIKGLLDPSQAELADCYIAPVDMEINGRKVLQGTWLLGVVYKDDAIWKEIKEGKRTGFSIGGFARRTPLEPEAATPPAREVGKGGPEVHGPPTGLRHRFDEARH